MANHEFVAYIDESGDDGLENFRPVGVDGTSHWLVLGCCIVRRENDLGLVASRDAISRALGRNKRTLHFSSVRHEQKTVICQMMSALPIQVTHVLCCKAHIPDAVETYKRTNQLYWYLCRMLVERISWFAWHYHKTKNPLTKIVFSTRGEMRYVEFRGYMKNLKQIETKINWNTVSPDLISSASNYQLAGLQLADASAGAFASAVEPNHYGNTEQAYARILRPIVYRRKGNFLSYGVKFRCDDKNVSPAVMDFMKFYGKK